MAGVSKLCSASSALLATCMANLQTSSPPTTASTSTSRKSNAGGIPTTATTPGCPTPTMPKSWSVQRCRSQSHHQQRLPQETPDMRATCVARMCHACTTNICPSMRPHACHMRITYVPHACRMRPARMSLFIDFHMCFNKTTFLPVSWVWMHCVKGVKGMHHCSHCCVQQHTKSTTFFMFQLCLGPHACHMRVTYVARMWHACGTHAYTGIWAHTCPPACVARM